MSRIEMFNLIKVIEKALGELDESQYQELLAGRGKIKFIGFELKLKKERVKGRESSKVSLTDNEIRSLTEKLKQCNTREAALELLHENGREILRESLERLARSLQVYVTKSDRNNVIEDKIVEFLVGVRLRTEAIRGLNFNK